MGYSLQTSSSSGASQSTDSKNIRNYGTYTEAPAAGGVPVWVWLLVAAAAYLIAKKG